MCCKLPHTEVTISRHKYYLFMLLSSAVSVLIVLGLLESFAFCQITVITMVSSIAYSMGNGP